MEETIYKASCCRVNKFFGGDRFVGCVCHVKNIKFFFQSDYYDLLTLAKGRDDLQFLKTEKKNWKVQRESKIYSEKCKNLVTQFPENKVVEISDDEAENDRKDVELNCVPSAFCYSHFLLLTYSVSYQLWKKSELKESLAKSNDSAS